MSVYSSGNAANCAAHDAGFPLHSPGVFSWPSMARSHSKVLDCRRHADMSGMDVHGYSETVTFDRQGCCRDGDYFKQTAYAALKSSRQKMEPCSGSASKIWVSKHTTTSSYSLHLGFVGDQLAKHSTCIAGYINHGGIQSRFASPPFFSAFCSSMCFMQYRRAGGGRQSRSTACGSSACVLGTEKKACAYATSVSK